MFYQPSDGHGLPHNPFNALVAPRPIGWISSQDQNGQVNLAPYSFFNAVAYTPPQVMFAATGTHMDGGYKDSAKNIEETGEFVVNIVSENLLEKMNVSSVAAPRDVDEFELGELTKLASEIVKVPRVGESLAQLECKHTQTVALKTDNPDNPNLLILGEVVGIHIDDTVLTDGLVDIKKLKPLSRLGYMDYAVVDSGFTMRRPDWPLDLNKK